MSEAKITLTGEDLTGPAVASAKRNLDSLTQKTEISAKQMAASMRMVPAQMTDIFVSLASGQKPITVLLQQGGQLKDMFGGVMPAAKALGTYLASLINPVTILAGAVGGLYLAYEQGASESRELNKVLIMTGNYAGQTASSLNETAKAIAKVGGTRNDAADLLVTLISTGKIASDQLVSVGQAATLMAKASGQSMKDLVGEFVALGEEPVQASAKLNSQYHYLTQSVYEQIKALEEEGRKEAAVALAQGELASAMSARAKEIQGNLGMLERGWNSIAGAAKNAWDKMLGIGRAETTDEKIAGLKEQLAIRAKKFIGTDRDQGVATGDAKIQAQIDFLEAVKHDQAKFAQRQGDSAFMQGEAISATDRVNKLQDQAKGVAAVNRELEKYRADLARIREVNPTSALLDPKAIKAGEDAIRKAHQGTVSKNEFGIDARVKALQGQLQQQERAVRASLDQIKTDYDLGLITAKQYLDQQYEAEQASLERRLVIVRQQEEIARGKKNIAAQEQYKNEGKKILDEIEQNFVHHGSAVSLQAAKSRRAVDEYTASLANQLRTRQAGIDDELAGAGLSDRERQQQQALHGVRREFDDKREDLRRQLQKGEANGGISQEQYDSELKALGDYYQRRLGQEQDYNAKSDALRGEWQVGAKKAYADYLDGVKDVAGQSNRLFTDAMQGMEDALVQLATTGKLSFKSLANSIIADIARMNAKALVSKLFDPKSDSGGMLGGLLGKLFGSSGAGAGGGGFYNDAGGLEVAGSLGFAKGGVFQTRGLSAYSNTVVNRPTMFAFARGAGLMGEAGPEAIMPLRRGADGRLGVAAAGAGGGDRDMQLTIINNTSAPIGRVTERRISPSERALIIEESRRASVAALHDPNSPESRALGGNFGLKRSR